MIWMTQLVWALQGDIWYEGSPVNDATVYVLDERLQSQSVQTDQNGHFDCDNFEHPWFGCSSWRSNNMVDDEVIGLLA